MTTISKSPVGKHEDLLNVCWIVCPLSCFLQNENLVKFWIYMFKFLTTFEMLLQFPLSAWFHRGYFANQFNFSSALFRRIGPLRTICFGYKTDDFWHRFVLNAIENERFPLRYRARWISPLNFTFTWYKRIRGDKNP